MRCEFARDDGAYVLGALAPAERDAYERHLPGCQACRDAVAELAVLPGLLGRLDAAAAEQIALTASRVPLDTLAEPSRLPRLLHAAQVSRRRSQARRRWQAAGALLAAACLALVVGVGVNVVGDQTSGSRPPVAMAAMVPAAETGHTSPVTAEVGLTETTGGTKVRMHCAYPSGGDYHDQWTFRLYAYGRDGRSEEVASWIAGPGDDLWVDGTIRYARSELTRLELRLGDNPLLVYTVG